MEKLTLTHVGTPTLHTLRSMIQAMSYPRVIHIPNEMWEFLVLEHGLEVKDMNADPTDGVCFYDIGTRVCPESPIERGWAVEVDIQGACYQEL